jgi:hypothetical protein
VKTLESHFVDWHSDIFGYGYGTGEEHTVPALKKFFAAFGDEDRPNSYDYRKLEAAVGPVVAWLLINVLCKVGVIEYGSSPRFAWLTPQGQKVKAFIDVTSADALVELTTSWDENYIHCYPDACNCGPSGYEEGRKCDNPFWK